MMECVVPGFPWKESCACVRAIFSHTQKSFRPKCSKYMRSLLISSFYLYQSFWETMDLQERHLDIMLRVRKST
jgi:hypothetical protein